jgi:ABC-type uncharacterized transport system substrate-binding protein
VFVEAGGAVSYGPDATSVTERGAVFVTRILRRANPGDLPIECPSKFELVVKPEGSESARPDDSGFRGDRGMR